MNCIERTFSKNAPREKRCREDIEFDNVENATVPNANSRRCANCNAIRYVSRLNETFIIHRCLRVQKSYPFLSVLAHVTARFYPAKDPPASRYFAANKRTEIRNYNFVDWTRWELLIFWFFVILCFSWFSFPNLPIRLFRFRLTPRISLTLSS